MWNESRLTMNKDKSAKIKDTVFKISALLILLAAGVYLFNPFVAACTMAVGVIGFGWGIFTSPYPGKSMRGKRLASIRVFGVIAMAVATYLMFEQMNEWVLAMFIGAILILYTAIILPHEYAREQREENNK